MADMEIGFNSPCFVLFINMEMYQVRKFFNTQTVMGGVVGGTAEEIGGGKFANGAVTGAFTVLFNNYLHSTEYKFKTQLIKTYKYFSAARQNFDQLPLDPLTKEEIKMEFFIDQVKTKGPFDIKRTTFSAKSIGGPTAYFEGEKLTPDDFGNYNFGVAAKAFGYSLEFAKFGAGMYQVFRQGGGDLSNWKGYFDFKRDTEMIIKGYNRY